MSVHCLEAYTPAEDSYLTARTLVTLPRVIRTLHVLSSKCRKLVCAEVGVGSGILTLTLLEAAKSENLRNIYVVCTDIDLNACLCTKSKISEQDLDQFVDFIVCDVLSCVREDYRIHLLYSNPPYLPEEELSICDPRYCGGPDGRLVIDKILGEVIRRRVSILVLTQSSLSDIVKTVRYLREHNHEVILYGMYHMLFEDIVTIIAVLL